jgi:hypothetical protein
LLLLNSREFDMSISAVGAAHTAPLPQTQAPKVNDHDSDDGVTAAAAPSAPAAPAPGTGVSVDKSA